MMGNFKDRLENQTVWNADITSSNACVYKIPREELREFLEEENLELFEELISHLEEMIFVGPFTVRLVEHNLQLVVASENLTAMQEASNDVLRNSPFRDLAIRIFSDLGMQHLADEIETGQLSHPKDISLSEKKDYYREIFDDMSETLTRMKSRLEKMQGKAPSNPRFVSLLERSEKCAEAIDKIRDVIRDFQHLINRQQFS